MALSLPDLFWQGVAAGIAATIVAGTLVGWAVIAFFAWQDRQVDEQEHQG